MYQNTAQIRQEAEAFMTSVVTLYRPTITYDVYGSAIVVSGEASIQSAYVGALSGTDRELLSTLARDGMRATYTATILLPYTTPIYDDTVIHYNDHAWRVLWHNNDTTPDVRIYTKCIVARTSRYDEIEQ